MALECLFRTASLSVASCPTFLKKKIWAVFSLKME